IEIQLLARELAQLLGVRVSRRYERDDALLDPLWAQLEVERVRVTLRQHVLDLVRDLHDSAVGAIESDAKALVKVCCVLIHLRVPALRAVRYDPMRKRGSEGGNSQWSGGLFCVHNLNGDRPTPIRCRRPPRVGSPPPD